MNAKFKQLGQGMTEYIIIVALVAVAAITVYNIFGDTVRSQVGNMAAELGGGDMDTQGLSSTVTKAGSEGGNTDYTLENFEQTEE